MAMAVSFIAVNVGEDNEAAVSGRLYFQVYAARNSTITAAGLFSVSLAGSTLAVGLRDPTNVAPLCSR